MNEERSPGKPPRTDPLLHDLGALGETMALRGRLIAAEESRLGRLAEVLDRYAAYPGEDQRNLADVAVDWAVASLAASGRCSDIESHFHRMVDAMYASIDYGGDGAPRHGERPLAADERRQLFETSWAALDRDMPLYWEIMGASARSLRDLGERHPCRLLFEVLSDVRRHYIEHAHVGRLRELIVRCVAMCKANALYRLGGGPLEDVMETQRLVADAATKVSESVEEAVRRGELYVKDGEIRRAER